MFREDEFGSFAPLSGVFPSVFVQTVWVAVDLQEEFMMLDHLLKE